MTAAWTWRGIRGSSIDGIWPIVWPCLEGAVSLTEGRLDEESVQDLIRQGDMQLWMAGPLNSPDKMAVTTELVVYPRQKWCRIVLAGGKGLPHAFGFLGIIESWAKTHGCVGVEGYGRPEWARLLARHGYKAMGHGYQRKL